MSVEEMEKAYKETIKFLRKITSDTKPKRFVLPFSSVLHKRDSINLICEAEQYSQDKYTEFKKILKNEFLSH